MHCYELMKDEPKWMDSKHNKGPRQAEVDTQSQFTPFAEDTAHQSADDSSPTPSPWKGNKRPMGREASKNKSRKISSSSSAASEFVSQLQVMSLDKEKYWKHESERRTAEHNDFLMLEREKLALQRQAEERQAQQMQRAEDERILGIDLEKCPTEALRTSYAILQQEILDRIKQAAANRGK